MSTTTEPVTAPVNPLTADDTSTVVQPRPFDIGIGQLDEPCWTFELAGGAPVEEDDGAGHYNRADAETAAAAYKATTRKDVQVVQEGFRCYDLILMCGTTFVYHGDYDENHFVDENNLRTAMEQHRVVQVGPDQYAEPGCCNSCNDAAKLLEEETARGELPGQLAIDDLCPTPANGKCMCPEEGDDRA